MIISVVIPSLNQGRYLRETLNSILDQADPGVEIIVVDGGSTDETLSLLKSYGDKVLWQSGPDAGQTDAINQGLRRAAGGVQGYVNADDPLLPGCLAEIRETFTMPDVMWAGGIGEVFDESGVRGEIAAKPVTRAKNWLTPWNRPDPYVVPYSGCNFMRRELIETIGLFDESYHYSMDIEHGVRAVFRGNVTPFIIPKRLARWRWHPESKTMKRGIAYAFREDEIRIAETYASYLPKDEQQELRAELRREKLLLPPRKACALLAEGNRSGALRVLMGAVARQPASLVSRPWLGAFRRVLTDSSTIQ